MTVFSATWLVFLHAYHNDSQAEDAFCRIGICDTDGVLTVLSPGRKIEAFRVDPRTDESTPMPVDDTLAKEAIAYYQTASRAFSRGAMHAPAKAGP